MRLNRVLTATLMLIDPSHSQFVEERDTSGVELDKALYGCVEAVVLWYANLCVTMRKDGFATNPYDPCVYNNIGMADTPIPVTMHVDDLLITILDDDGHERFEKNMRKVYR